MNKHLTLLLFIGLAWGQTSDIDILEHTKKLRQKLKNDSLNNPCNDKRYLELKKVAVTKMKKEDLKYYRSMRKKCSESKGSKPKSNRSRSGKSFKIIQKELGWNNIRAMSALHDLQKEGMCWVDCPNGPKDTKFEDINYWIPSVALKSSKNVGNELLQKSNSEVYDEGKR